MEPDPRARTGERRTLMIGAAALAAAGVGWFLLSHLVIGTTSGDAVGEAVGVVLALLVVASIAGAFRSARGHHR